MTKRVIKLNKKDLIKVVNESNTYDGVMDKLYGVEKQEKEISNYMFFQNLKEIKENIDILLSLPEKEVDAILTNGHDWATDHIATSKDDIEEVTSFLKHNIGDLQEGKKKGLWANIRAKRKRCEKPSKPGDEDYPSKETWAKLTKKESISEDLKYHIKNNIPITENVFRFGSEAYFNLLKETRSLYFKGKLKLDGFNEEFVTSDAGTKGSYNGKSVWLDVPFEYGDFISEAEYKGSDVELNKPTRNSGEGKKYMVYVKDPSTGNVRKITFGDKKGGLTAKVSNPEARKSFSARHKCSEKKDKLSPGYWACRLTKFGHLFGGKTYPGYL